MIDAETINCWKLNYGLDNRTPADAMQWWHDNDNGRAPAGVVAALGLCLDEIEALKATISRIEKDSADTLELLSSDIEEKHRLNMEYANAVLHLRVTISRLRDENSAAWDSAEYNAQRARMAETAIGKLREYARHHDGCKQFGPGNIEDACCDCGYHALLAGLEDGKP